LGPPVLWKRIRGSRLSDGTAQPAICLMPKLFAASRSETDTMSQTERIVIELGKRGGQPTIRGLRITV
jgi:hypothetical protein